MTCMPARCTPMLLPSNQYDPIFAGTQRNFHGCWLDPILSTTARQNEPKTALISIQITTPTHISSNPYTGSAGGDLPKPSVLPSSSIFPQSIRFSPAVPKPAGNGLAF